MKASKLGSVTRLISVAGFFLLTILVLANPARAQGYYEQFGPYCSGTGQECFGDPVDVATGSFHINETLFRIPGRLPLTIGWQFTSQDASDGPLGVGTSLSTDYFLAADELELLTPGNRHFVFFGHNANGDFTNTTDPEVLGATFHFTNEGTGGPSALRWISGVKFFFDGQGSLYRIEDRHGNFLTIARNVKGYPTEINQADGRSTTFAYNAAGKLESVTTSLNRTWQFSYDSWGRLISVTDPGGAQTRYTWTNYERFDTGLPLVQSVIDPRGHTHVTNQYDVSGRVTTQTYADGGVLTASYSFGTGLGGTTVVTDPLGNVTTWEYEWNPGLYGYNVTRVTDPLGRATTFERTGGTNLVTGIVDFLGRRTALGWDHSQGLLESVTRPTASGGTATWNLTYDTEWNRPTLVTDPLAGQTKFSVDPRTGNVTEITDALNNTTAFRYSAKGDLTSVTNALGQTTRLDYYTEQGDLRRITDPLGHETEFTYDDASRLTAIRDANLKTVQIGYNALNLVTSRTQTLNGNPLTTSYQYDSEGNLRFLTDAKNQVWEWLYDDMGRVAQEKDPLSQSAFYSWDQNGNLLTWTDRLGQKGEHTYGKGDRLTGISFRKAGAKKKKKKKKKDGPVESTVSYAYNERTQLLESIADSLFGTYSYTYDALDRLTGKKGPNGSLSYTLDDLGRRTGMQVTGQGAITYVYDATDNLASITQDGQIYSFSYDALGRLIKRNLPNGVNTEWAFDEAAFLKSIVSAKAGQVPFDSHTYTRDAVGGLIGEDSNGDLRRYTYDDLYRLASAKVGGVDYSWTYDEAGNRLTQTVGGKSNNYAYDADNRLTSVDGLALTHDANGNPLAFGDDTYSWDVRGRLASVTRPGVTSQFTYDMFGLRTGKNVNGATTSYLLDGLDVVSEIATGNAVHTLHGPEIDQPLSRGGLYFTPDHLGSTATLTDSAGNVVQRYLYSPFGETSPSTGVSNPFQFTGREMDETGLYYYRARYYAPFSGRFISEDPIGFDGGQTNLFTYVDSDPINLRDPDGLGSKILGDKPGNVTDLKKKRVKSKVSCGTDDGNLNVIKNEAAAAKKAGDAKKAAEKAAAKRIAEEKLRIIEASGLDDLPR